MDKQTGTLNAAEPFNNGETVNKQTTPTTTDDESTITTSTASDTFESWTLVTDKQKDKTKPITTDEEPGIEDLRRKNDESDMTTSRATTSVASTADEADEEEQEFEPPPDYEAAATTTSATDEFSDEISIISESDSGDLLTTTAEKHTQPYSSEHLHKLNLKFTTGVGLDLPTLMQQQQLEEQRLQQKREFTPPRQFATTSTTTRQRKRRSPSTEQQSYLKSLQTTTTVERKKSTTKLVPLLHAAMYEHFVKLVLSALVAGVVFFIFAGTLGRMSFFNGAQQNHEIESIESLGNKIRDIQLENNLLHAELDYLSKQVNYLNALNEGKQQPPGEFSKYQKPKSRRPWQKEENIQAQTYEEIPNVAKTEPELAANEPKNDGDLNEFGYELFQEGDSMWNEYLRQPVAIEPETIDETKKDAEQVATDGAAENKPEENLTKPDTKNRRLSKDQDFQNEQQQPLQQEQRKQKSKKKYDNSKERLNKPKKNVDSSKERFRKENDDDSDEDDDDDSKERFNKKLQRDDDTKFVNSKERTNKKFERNGNNKNNGNNNKRFDNSRERFNNKFDNSKERQYKNNKNNNNNKNFKERDFNSKERRDKRKANNFSGEQQTGEWMENLMRQREEARRQQEQNLDAEKNWYLNRHDSREQWRHVDNRS